MIKFNGFKLEKKDKAWCTSSVNLENHPGDFTDKLIENCILKKE